MIFPNGSAVPLNQSTGNVPNVGDAIVGYFQPMVFGIVVKEVVNFQVVETKTSVNFLGVWQPLSDRQLMIKPEGQRAWKWFWVHAAPTLSLVPDELITYRGEQFRVMGVKDYSLYGYNEYQLVSDYTGSGPQEAP